MSLDLPTFEHVLAAAARIEGKVRRTPVMRSAWLDDLLGAELHFKCEHLQDTGAFKLRGASNAVLSLDEETARRGVVTQSSGNHGAAIALAAKRRGIPAHVVVPRDASAVKLEAVRAHGAHLRLCEPGMDARNAVCAEVQASTGAHLIHPFDDARVIAGQGTAALELVDEVTGLDCVIAPVSGGGLMSGTCLAVHGRDPRIQLFAAEPAGARDTFDALAAGHRPAQAHAETICDGLRAIVGVRPFAILREHLAGVVLASDAETVRAMRLIWERLKQVVEPSAAIVLAAVMADRERFAGKRIGLILSGGNLDLDALPGLFALGQQA